MTPFPTQIPTNSPTATSIPLPTICDNVITSYYSGVSDPNGYRIVGCKTSVYCNSYGSNNYAGTVECAYNPVNDPKAQRNFNDAYCDKTACESQGQRLCCR